ncbi:hypothetical protein B0T17DRAFT_594533 [Bombardia bombarda]|uniref:JmjC domain-containing protein n=1 Tax=Bombardia bombarda TaxID=252184 RepID=A0AA40CDE5_9PEZI|nr:hypothetical protein B0T17DRAFT_594533 [Bombardia bombarda]
MPTPLHPQAKFDPIPPDLDLHSLVENTPNFQWVTRISAAQIRNIGPQEFEKLVLLHVIHGGKPLVIERWGDRLPKSLFSAEWLETTQNKKQENVRDIVNQTDIPMTTGHYLRSMKQLTNQWTPTNFRDERRQRLYLKDIDCPPEWQERLQKVIPPVLFYMNENVEERASKGRGEDVDMFQDERSAAPAGDLMSSLPEQMRAQNLMCYIGHEGTYTPAHREMCASLGQNIMIDASGDENGEKPGSSIWFMTETKDREVVREYFLSMLGHDIEIEKHFAQINAWKKGGFPVYIVEQRVGDFILVPPLAPHQVWNRGTRTIKVAWNRTTVETLDMALHEALPKARIVCRDEQYKNKAIVYFTLDKYYKQMLDMEKTADVGLLGLAHDLIRNSARVKQMASDFQALFRLYTKILMDEMFATKEKDVELIEFDSNITCSYCRANIFNRFLTCKHCVRELVGGDQDTYDICMECYVMGRSCLCVSNLSWCEQWEWSHLVDCYEDWRAMTIKNDGYINFETSPLPLELARKKFGKKAVAQICQEQLRRRPWKDISKVDKPVEEPEASEPEIDEQGRRIKKKKKRRMKKGDVYRCHVCCHKDYTYKLAFCSNSGCTDAYCYGVLYRAFDMMPQEVMQNEKWKCPKCLKICNCGSCRRAGNMTPYVPKNTLLGHDTRPIADDRSVESLVDFRVHNLSWLKNVGDDTRSLSSKRLQKLQQAAQAEKEKEADNAEPAPTLPDNELAESLDAALQQSIANGYGDQSEVLAASGMATGDYEMHNGDAAHDPQQLDTQARPVEEADMSISQDQSSYPDPSMLGHERMLGMGYYEQDDSPDKILFDPYQQPSAESMVVDDEPEESEYLKKQLRWAKRRARQEEDFDPDFAAPRSHHRKRARTGTHNDAQRDGQQEALNNMDPALFSQGAIEGGVTMLDAGADEDVPAEIANPVQADQPAEAQPATEEAEEPRDPNIHRPYSPNRPALRHARPKTTYLEDIHSEEEFNDIIIPRSQRPPAGITNYDPENANKDPLDLAAVAIFAASAAATAEGSGSAPAPAPTSTQKRRGRPPGRPRKSDEQPRATSRPAAGGETPKSTGKRRGRPPRSSLAAPPRSRADNSSDEDSDAAPADLDAELAEQLDGFDEDGEVIAPVSTSPKKRGRPPKAKPAETVAESSKTLMSMAERMRLKGKRIRITSRRTTGPTIAEKSKSPAAVETAASEEPAQARTAKRGRPSAGQRESETVEVDFDPFADEGPVSDEAPSPPGRRRRRSASAREGSAREESLHAVSDHEEAGHEEADHKMVDRDESVHDEPVAPVHENSEEEEDDRSFYADQSKHKEEASVHGGQEEAVGHDDESMGEDDDSFRSAVASPTPEHDLKPVFSTASATLLESRGLTVVRLMSSDDESQLESQSSSDSSGSDDEVIPAHVGSGGTANANAASSTPSRGRGGLRGRGGRGRGSRRRRGRGVARRGS